MALLCLKRFFHFWKRVAIPLVIFSTENIFDNFLPFPKWKRRRHEKDLRLVLAIEAITTNNWGTVRPRNVCVRTTKYYDFLSSHQAPRRPIGVTKRQGKRRPCNRLDAEAKLPLRIISVCGHNGCDQNVNGYCAYTTLIAAICAQKSTKASLIVCEALEREKQCVEAGTGWDMIEKTPFYNLN